MENTILINEFLPALDGVDQGREWLELVNVSNKIIDLSGWKIQVGGVRYNTAFTFPENSIIEPEEHLLICEEEIENCNHYTNLLAIQNGIGKTDGVRILNNSDKVINTVLYSQPNKNELENDLGEIAKEEDIIEMPPNDYSIARKDYKNSGHSVQDFFVTDSPTPGEKNTEVIEPNIVVSEVFREYIEFYTPTPPNNITEWYITINQEKINLSNNIKENFFVITKNLNKVDLELYNPEDKKIDSFSKDRISSKYSYCRVNSRIEENFIPCEPTQGQHNLEKKWEYTEISDILKSGQKADYIINPCVQYEYEDLYVISDESQTHGVKCQNCKLGNCYTSELEFKPYDTSLLYTIKETEFKDILIENVNSENYTDLLNQTVIVEGQYSSGCSCIEKDFGNINIESENLQNETFYEIKGVFKQKGNPGFYLEYPLVIKKDEREEKEILEDTGSPILLAFILFFLLTFLTIFMGYNLLRKLKPFIHSNNFVRMRSSS